MPGEAAGDVVDIYNDGACSGNPGPGGWGAVLLYCGREKELYGGEPTTTTNNRMEMMAAIKALTRFMDTMAELRSWFTAEISRFANLYADQNEKDHAQLVTAIASGAA